MKVYIVIHDYRDSDEDGSGSQVEGVYRNEIDARKQVKYLFEAYKDDVTDGFAGWKVENLVDDLGILEAGFEKHVFKIRREELL